MTKLKTAEDVERERATLYRLKEILNESEKEKGITLVALVVTIIVLLILAGVSISLVFNSEGLFSKANEAASKYNQAKEDEGRFLEGIDEYFDRYNSINGEGSGTVLPTVGTEVPEAGWTVAEAKGLVARDGLKAHLGEKVAYSPAEDTTGEYRIFYYDNEPNSTDPSKGYFGDPINTLYLKRDYELSDTKLTNYTSYATIDNGTLMRQMNPKWAVSTNGNEIDLVNEHCVAWLCDSSQWTKYKVDGVANYVIGSPSVEMYMKAYGVYKEEDGDPDRNSTSLVCKIGNENGYTVGAGNSYSHNAGYSTAPNTVEVGPNSIFTTVGGYWWWLASPSFGDNSGILFVGDGLVYAYVNNYNSIRGVCPVVSIS